MASKCERCGREIKRPWVSWYFDTTTRTTLNVWITCHPSECEATAMLAKGPNAYLLMDNWYNMLKERGIDLWKRNYNIPPEHVARVKALGRMVGR